MNHSINKQLTINAPLESVWEVLADFNNVYTWAPSVVHSAGINAKDNEVGAGRTCSIKGFGDIEEVITQWQEQQSFTFSISDLGPLTLANSRWQIKKLSEGKTELKVDFNYQLKFGVVGKLMHALIMRKKLEKGLTATTVALKTRIETGNVIRPLINTSKVAA